MDKRQVSKPYQWLIERCQYTGFGRVTFQVRSGEPDLTRPYRCTRTLKVTGDVNSPRPELARANFELRHEHTALFARLARLPDGTTVTVKVAHGLPCNTIDVEEIHRAA